MPIEITEFIKLIIGLFIFILPGFLLSYFFFSNHSIFERIFFAFITGLSIICISFFIFDVVFNIFISNLFFYIVYSLYLVVSIFLFYCYIKKEGLEFSFIKKILKPKFLLVVLILLFSFFMYFIPHFSDNYYLPFHVDEWIHWSYSKSFIEAGSSSFVNPMSGNGIIQSLEMGFHYFISAIFWISGSNFVTIFVFMPSIIGVFLSLAAFNLGQKSKRKFGFEAAIFVGLIPTTCRYLGPSFLVPVSFGLLFIIFILWFINLKRLKNIFYLPVFLFSILLIHPPSAIAILIIIFSFAIFLLIEKKYLYSLFVLFFSIIPVIILFVITSRWDLSYQQIMDAIFGSKYNIIYDLPKIFPSFEQLGIFVWFLGGVGIYLSFIKGNKIQKTLSLSALIFLLILFVYDRFSYGIPILYERAFLYLFLIILLLSAYSFFELRNYININSESVKDNKIKNILKKYNIVIPIFLIIILLVTIIPIRFDIPYYHMINEKEYNDFIWIRENVDDYNSNLSTNNALIDPYKASPFSAITRYYVISSSMHPVLNYDKKSKIKDFFDNNCKNIDFLKDNHIELVYGNCNSKNLSLIHPNVYILQDI